MNDGAPHSFPSQNPPPSGTFNLWIDSVENPDTFEPGIRQRLGEFRLGHELFIVCSDGPSLAATLHHGSADSRPLFHVPMALPRTRRRHLITIGWSKGTMKILLDSKVLAEVPLTFMIWLASVSWVLWSHCV
jgi:hypothetical protein